MATVSWETLRSLAGFKAEQGCAISLYLGLDPRESPTAGDVDTRMRSLLTEAEKSDASQDDALSHDEKQALRSDFDRIRSWFESDFDRDGVLGIAVFAGVLDELWTPLELPEPVRDGVRVSRYLHLAPLVPLVRHRDGAVVAAVGREKGEVYRLREGRLTPLADHTEEQPSQHDQGGWSQARYGRHIENLVLGHLKDVAEEVDRQVRRLHAPPVVVVATDEARARFTELLSQESRAALAGCARLPWPRKLDAVVTSALPRRPGRVRWWLENPILHYGEPTAARRAAARVASDRAAIAAVAVERFRRAHAGGLPGALPELSPEFLTSIPEDPFSGRPLLYRRDETGYVVYSVGENRVDDNGAVEPEAADLGLRLSARQR